MTTRHAADFSDWRPPEIIAMTPGQIWLRGHAIKERHGPTRSLTAGSRFHGTLEFEDLNQASNAP